MTAEVAARASRAPWPEEPDYRSEMGVWDPSDDGDDGDGETDATPLMTDVAARFPNETVRCECPALEPYPEGWTTALQQDAVDAFADLPGAVWDAAREQLWVPCDPYQADWRLTCAGLPIPHLFETVFTRGCWIDLGPLGA